jgi:hypothetical protein
MCRCCRTLQTGKERIACARLREPVWAAAALMALWLASVTPEALAPWHAEPSTRALARILLEFVHVATPQQRQALNRIMGDPDATPADRTLAQAIANTLHTPDVGDLRGLGLLLRDCSQPRLVRTLARAIHDLVHELSSMQKKKILALVNNEGRACVAQHGCERPPTTSRAGRHDPCGSTPTARDDDLTL